MEYAGSVRKRWYRPLLRALLLCTLVALTLAPGLAPMPAEVAQAANLVVNTTADSGTGSLRAALTTANSNSQADTITFNLADNSTITLLSDLPTITEAQDLTITGNVDGSGDPTITIDGDGQYTIFRFDSGVASSAISISNLNLTGGTETAGSGGAVWNNGTGTVTLDNLVITDSEATADGGAVWNRSNATLIIQNSVLGDPDEPANGNVAGTGSDGGNGGAVYNAGTLEVSNTVMSNNSTSGIFSSSPSIDTGRGGGIFSVGTGTLTIQGSEIISNTAQRRGGGIYTRDPLTMEDSQVDENTATEQWGGGIYFGFTVDPPHEITGSTINRNKANGSSGNGGGIYLNRNDTLYLTDTEVNNNETTGSFSGGGGIYAIDATLYVLGGSQVNGNTATFGGGGIYMAFSGGETTLFVRNSQVNNNEVTGTDRDGGGIYLGDGSTLFMSDSQVNGNSTIDNGGGIYGGTSDPDTLIEIEDSEIADNDAQSGGGIYVGFEDSLSLQGSQVFSNTAQSGGGIYVNHGYAQIVDSLIGDPDLDDGIDQGNVATASIGGGIYAGAEAKIDVLGSTVQANTAATDGGGIYIGGSDVLDMVVGYVHQNTAQNGRGGGIYNDGTVEVDGSTISDNAANGSTSGTGEGGGIYTGLGLNVTTRVVNSTISGNSAEQEGGGVFNFSTTSTDLAFTTVVSNSTANGTTGGLYTASSGLDILGTIVAYNTPANCSSAVGSTSTDVNNPLGYNLSDTDCNFSGGLFPNFGSADPQLGAPTNLNSSPVYPLLAGSDAINQVPNAACTDSNVLLATGGVDQRGAPRPATTGEDCDIGAYERQPVVDLELSKAAETTALVGDVVTYTITVTNNSSTDLEAGGIFTFTNDTALTIPVTGTADPAYPSTITVGAGAVTSDVLLASVILNDISHNYVPDLYVLVVAPDGRKVLLLGDSGDHGNQGYGRVLSGTLNFNDAGADIPGSILPGPSTAPIPGGFYDASPTNTALNTSLPAPAPAAPYETLLVPLDTPVSGDDVDGDWSLYVWDGNNNSIGGEIAGGWSLEFITYDEKIIVSDTLPAGVEFGGVTSATDAGWDCSYASGELECTGSGVAAGASSTIVFTGTVSSAGAIANTATVALSETALRAQETAQSNNSASATTVAQNGVDLAIAKDDGQTSVQQGATTAYTITVTNNSSSFSATATVTDSFPSALTDINWLCSPSPTSACDTVSGTGDIETIVTLQPTGVVTFNVSATVATTATGTLTNTASVSVSPDALVSDTNLANNSATDTTTITTDTGTEGEADLTIDKTAEPDSVRPGGTITYTLQVQNNGPDAASSITLTDELPASVTFVSATGDMDCAEDGGTVTCTLDSLEVDATANVQIVVTAPQTEGNLSNTASVASATSDPNGANSNNSASVTVSQEPVGEDEASMSLTKTAEPTTVQPGGTITYTLLVENAGPAAATNIVLTDTLPSGVTFVSTTATGGMQCSEAGGTVTCTLNSLADDDSVTATIVVTAPSIVGGLENTAAVNADNITQASNSSDSASISVSDTSDGPGNIYLPIMVR